MTSIKNIEIGHFDIDSTALSSTGISSCIGMFIELENKIFLYHIDPSQYNIGKTYWITDVHDSLTNIFQTSYQSDEFSVIKNVLLIGGWNNSEYIELRNKINTIRENYANVTAEKPNSFHQFVNSIKLNLIGFNVSSKEINGKDKQPDDDDHLNDYIFDCTIVYDRSSSPSTIAIWQYGGIEGEMNSDRSEPLIMATYIIDPVVYQLKAFLSQSISKSSYFKELLNQVLFNVNDKSHIYKSFDDNMLKKKLDDILRRIEQRSLFDEI